MTSNSRYFSGFCFENEKSLFGSYLEESEFIVAGFSYGSIKAFEYALNSDTRVDKLQLLSPAFFQHKDESFKKAQLIAFKRNKDVYISEFLKNTTYKSSKMIREYFKQGTLEELEELLNYIWSGEKLQRLLDKGTKIEVFLGSEDIIVDTNKAHKFFKDYAEVYYIKDVGHLL